MIERISDYNIEWDRPGKGSIDSMPLGNGEIGINVWVEDNRDIVLYLAKTDAWNENARLLKLGKIRLKCLPNQLPTENMIFSQKLSLADGSIRIRMGGVEDPLDIKIWVDANQPQVVIEVKRSEEFGVEAELELWRTKQRELIGRELHSAYGLEGGPNPVVEDPDIVISSEEDRLVWCHRNQRSIWEGNLRLQGLDAAAVDLGLSDPLLGRTFGGMIYGEGLVRNTSTRLISVQSKSHYMIRVTMQTDVADNVNQWLGRLADLTENLQSTMLEEHWRAHSEWWEQFWNRSWIYVTAGPNAFEVTQGYILQRYMNACAGRGNYPIKFNGSLFTMDVCEPDECFNADYRRWGGPYWFQNTRLIYWPMLASGDFDCLLSWFRMYREALPLALRRTPLYYQHEGAFFPETMHFWGTFTNKNYGWDRSDKDLSQVDNLYIRDYWQGGLELLALMLDYFAYTQEDHFVKEVLVPLADGIVTFYEQHYQKNDKGRLVLYPAKSLETYQDALNPLPDIAGLYHVLPRLMALPEEITMQLKQKWSLILSALPALPIMNEGENKVILPAEKVYGVQENSENPELYAIFPYRLFGIGKPGLETARRTFEKRSFKEARCWRQDAIQAARLGLYKTAQQMVVEHFTQHYSECRFPAFWGPNFDWVPDQDHGNVAVMALQSMLVQAEGEETHLLPAWPEDWEVDFKLHVPFTRTVQGKVKEGRLWMN